ncbi:Ribonuclease Y [Methylobacterium haplocladii]|nr:Ribonuclease Y [Methylobacterium haplocladii]
MVVDLLDPEHASNVAIPQAVTAIVSDVSLSHSEQVAALRQQLDRLGPRRPPFVCLLHNDTPRSRAQAHALGADRTIDSSQAARLLAETLDHLGELQRDAETIAATTASAMAADDALTRIFDLGRSGQAPGLHQVVSGADLVVDALQKADIRGWLDVVWHFDDATHQHCLLVAGLAAGFAQQLGLSEPDCRQLTQAALLHDLGKSRIPLAILNKPSRLDANEIAVMRTHPVIGHEMLRNGDFSDTMLAVVRSHHEALDGSGYPDNLRADRIPDIVRLVTVCDVFGALIERRPYRRPLAGNEAYEILRSMDGKIDIDLVRAFQPLAEAAGTVADAA